MDHYSLPTLLESGNLVFRECVFDEVKGRVAEAILGEVARAQGGAVDVDTEAIKVVVGLYEAMGASAKAEFAQTLEQPLRSSGILPAT